MDMKSYLNEMKHAVSALILLVWEDHAAVEEAGAKLKKLEAETQRGYQASQRFANDDIDDDGLATATHWDTYFGPDKERFHAQKDLDTIKASLSLLDFSRQALSAALLQFAKQGLSIIHGSLQDAPAARIVANVELKNLIWQGRNQALHWEESNPHKAVVDCFEQLKAADQVFNDYKTSCMAFEVVKSLEWKNWSAFEEDMLSLS